MSSEFDTHCVADINVWCLISQQRVKSNCQQISNKSWVLKRVVKWKEGIEEWDYGRKGGGKILIENERINELKIERKKKD